ncbi:Holliday junction recognition protein [Fukomys damarensis]|uniref:Holliday junction recognition protein n=1 Tax=Fukomys damarensis TaxID=885580 RepID=A0A091EAZ7_FUKDA|nr:Holliday junction recognition protein [Fukomys damarensis]
MEVQVLESERLAEDPLLSKLRDSRRRFQRRMQQLIAKYEHPFEDAPLVQMSTLTYRTPQGSESSDAGAASDQGDLPARTWMPAVPRSPLRDELRRKYLTQVDILLQGTGRSEGKDTPRAPAPSLASPAMLAPGYSGDDSTESLGNTAQPPSSPRAGDPLHPCPVDLAVAPSSAHHFSSPSSEASGVCDVTISDLYAGMLHSMSRLLSAKPSCIISTKTFIVQSWSSRRRQPRRSRVHMNETYCRGARPSRRSAKEQSAHYPEPRREKGTLRDCRNLLHTPRHRTGFKLEKASLHENTAQLQKLDPSWKERQVTPQKCSSLAYLDFSAVHLDWENRLMTLKWLISPVKMVSRPRMLQGCAESRYREIESKFDRLHRECCLSPGRKQPRTSGRAHSWALALYRGGCVSPGSVQGSESHRLPLPFCRAKATSLSETFEHLGRRSADVRGCRPQRDSSSSLSKSLLPQSAGRYAETASPLQGHSCGTIRRAISSSHAVSVPSTQPPSRPKSRHDEVKDTFARLHQKYTQASPPMVKVPSGVAVSADKARAEVQCQAGHGGGKLNLDTCLLPGCQWPLRSPLGSAVVEAPVSAGTAWGAPPIPTKRRRLSDSQVCGLQSRGASQPLPAQMVRKGDTCWSL